MWPSRHCTELKYPCDYETDNCNPIWPGVNNEISYVNPLVPSAIFFSRCHLNLQGSLKIVKIEFHFFIFILKGQIKKFFFRHILTLSERHICAGAEFFLIKASSWLVQTFSKQGKYNEVIQAYYGAMEAHHEPWRLTQEL